MSGKGAKGATLIGAGGHARAVVEALEGSGGALGAYVDPRAADWLEAEHFSDDGAAGLEGRAIVLGLGGVDAPALRRRLALLDDYLARGCKAAPLVHPAATVSLAAILEPGAIVLAAAVVQPGVRLERGALVNTGAIVEHDSRIGAGAHIAPGAVVLGGCTLGACAMIGAGAVLLPGTRIDEGALVAAASLYPASVDAAREASGR
jgi:sugar O-acyltransferase (sialic acid O-acetyltransferase NeuD family)